MFRSFLYVVLGVSVLFAVPPSESHANWNRQFRQSARYWQRQYRQADRQWSNRWDRQNTWSYRRGYGRPYRYRGRYRAPYRGGVFIGPYGVTW